jgi:hypothetical protein
MAADDQIHRLNRELSRHSFGPVTTVSNQAVASLGSGLQALVTWLRDAARAQPLIALLLAFQGAYAIARLGRRHARR